MAITLSSTGTLGVLQSVAGSQGSVSAAHLPRVLLNANGGVVTLEADKAEELKNLGRQILEIAHNFGAR